MTIKSFHLNIITLLTVIQLNAQGDIIIKPKFEFPLDTTSKFQIEELINFDNLFIYSKHSDGNNIYEYHKASDSTYLYIHTNKQVVLSKGLYKITKDPIDTIKSITFDYDTYDEKIKILHRHELIKIKEWNEHINDSLYMNGRYSNGFRTGVWYKSKQGRNFYRFGEYYNNELVKIYSPDLNTINKYLHWIIGKKYQLCSIYSLQDINRPNVERFELNVNADSECFKVGTFNFMKNGEFNYAHNMRWNVNMKEFQGKGTWKLDENGNIIITFANDIQAKYDVRNLTPTSMNLQQIKK